MSYWTSIMPFLIIIPIAIWTKQVLPGLTLGLLVASYVKEPSPLGGIETMASYLLTNLSKETSLQVIGFLYIFAGIVNMIKMTGGIKGFIEITSNKIKTEKQAIFLIWFTLIGTFISPNLRIVTIAPIMKAMQEQLNITKERISFVIEASSLPIITLIPVGTAFIGYMTSTIETSLKDIAPNADPYLYFLKSIPFNIFSIITIVLAVIYSVFKHPTLFNKSENKQQLTNEEKKKKWGNSDEAAGVSLKSKPANLFIPLSLALGLSIFLSWWDGYQKTSDIFKAFIAADVSSAMFIAIIITLLLTFVQFLIEKWPLKKLVAFFFDGGNDLIPAFALFALVWGLASATKDLGLSQFVTFSMGWIPNMLVPPTTFILGSVLAYFIGSTWGSWGLLMPIGLSLAEVSGNSISLMIGVIFASGTFGGLTSPLTGTTVTISKIMELNITDYSKYKIKHCIIPFILSAILYGVVTLIL